MLARPEAAETEPTVLPPIVVEEIVLVLALHVLCSCNILPGED